MKQHIFIGALMILGIFSLLGQKHNREKQFWEWFQKNEDKLFKLQGPDDNIFSFLASEIKKVDRDLNFEVGPVENGRREFVLSAGGLKSVFPAVDLLAKAAPPLRRWTITKFRPRRAELTEIQINETSISANQVMVSFQPDSPYMNVTIYLGKRDLDEDVRGQLGFLFLDQSLGEFDVATYLGRIDFEPEDSSLNTVKVSLESFVRDFDNFKASLK